MLYTGIVRDVSERKMMEKALRDSDRMALIGKMARGIGHDLGNLLFGLNMAASLLDSSPATARRRQGGAVAAGRHGLSGRPSHGLQDAATDALHPGMSQTTRLLDSAAAAALL